MQKRNKDNLSKLHIRRGDKVKVLAGNSKSLIGNVIAIFPKSYRAIVSGVNIVHKHKKPSAKNPKGKIVKEEATIHISNLMLIDPESNFPVRIGRRLNEDKKLQRYSKKSGNFI